MPYSTLVFGSSGGIGNALTHELVHDPECGRIFTVNRKPPHNALQQKIVSLQGDVTEEDSLKQAVQQLRQHLHYPLRLVLVATGALYTHHLVRPEKSWRELNSEQMIEQFRINSIAPALIAKHTLPLLPRKGKAVFGVLSARVGSLSDNRLGGWYSYRASKAALNMILKTLSIELARTHKQAICLGLHPGTVDTGLSKPFQKNVPPEKLFTPGFAARRLLKVIAQATPALSGRCIAWDGKQIPY